MKISGIAKKLGVSTNGGLTALKWSQHTLRTVW